MTVQLALTQEVTTLLNPWSRQRHASSVIEHSDSGKEAPMHSTYTTVGQRYVLHTNCTCLT